MLEFKITNINRSFPEIKDKNTLPEIGKKKIKQMNEPIDKVTVRGQQKCDLLDILNLVEIEINDERILNTLKNHKKFYYKLTPIGILFLSAVTNNTKQISVTFREFNNAKVALTNGKTYSFRFFYRSYRFYYRFFFRFFYTILLHSKPLKE